MTSLPEWNGCRGRGKFHRWAVERWRDYRKRCPEVIWGSPNDRWSTAQQIKVAWRQSYVCPTCRKLLPVDWVLDHHLPIWQGGHDEWSNLVIRCKPCFVENFKDQFRRYWEFKRFGGGLRTSDYWTAGTPKYIPLAPVNLDLLRERFEEESPMDEGSDEKDAEAKGALGEGDTKNRVQWNHVERTQVCVDQKYRCNVCRICLPTTWELDHIIPLHKRGLAGPPNLQLLCAQ
jgi:5-methylcytosine-specific restriction endonuclease McrA